MNPVVGVVMGSSSDWDTMQHAVQVLQRFGVAHEARVVSAHRMPDELFAYAEGAEAQAEAPALDTRSSLSEAPRLGGGQAAYYPLGEMPAGRAGKGQMPIRVRRQIMGEPCMGTDSRDPSRVARAASARPHAALHPPPDTRRADAGR